MHQEAPIAVEKPPSPILRALRVWRVEPGATVFVRMLGENYGGIFTHYFRGRSQCCRGEDCPAAVHNVDKIWKGYVAAELWVPKVGTKKGGVWSPICLEITEHLELDFRFVYQRGQTWELSRPAVKKGESSPITGVLAETRDPTTLPKAFDVYATLRAFYHVEGITLAMKNPLPARTLVTDSEDDGPELLRRPERVKIPDDFSFAEDHKRRMEQRKTKTQPVS